MARRWLMLCPKRRDEKRQPLEPTEFELNSIVNNKEMLAEIRCRLVKDFGKLFSVVAGQPQRIDEHRSKDTSRRYRSRKQARELLLSV